MGRLEILAIFKGGPWGFGGAGGVINFTGSTSFSFLDLKRIGIGNKWKSYFLDFANTASGVGVIFTGLC